MKALIKTLFCCAVALASVLACVTASVTFAETFARSSAEDDARNANPWKFDAGTQKLIAIGDVHGAYDALFRLLLETGLISAAGNWQGGNSHLVSLGDLLDRGPEVRKVLDLLMKLEQQASIAGGGVHLVMGNHELMVMTGDLRYVSAEDYAAYREEESPQERALSLRHYGELQTATASSAIQEAFEQSFPPGFNGLKHAFSLEGKYGAWLSRAPLMIKIGDTLFLHGGLSKALYQRSLTDINEQGHDDLLGYLSASESLQEQGLLPLTLPNWDRTSYLKGRYLQWQKLTRNKKKLRKGPSWLPLAQKLVRLDQSFIFTQSSPLWYRGSALCNPNSESIVLEKLLRQFGVRRVVVGHTPTRSRRVTSRMDQQLIMLDTGMLESFYHGHPAALILQNNSLGIHYLGDDSLVDIDQEQPRMLAQPATLSDIELEEFLRSATVSGFDSVADPIVDSPVELQAQRFSGTDTDSGTIIELSRQGTQLHARLSYTNHSPSLAPSAVTEPTTRKQTAEDAAVNEVAAYRLDRLLGLYITPVAVQRTLGGRPAVLQYQIEDTFSEAQRVAEQLPIDGYCELPNQQQLISVFSALADYQAQPDTNPIYTRKDKLAWLTDFRSAFGTNTSLSSTVRDNPPEISRLLSGKLAALSESDLEEALSDVLSSAQIQAILKRRDGLLKLSNR